MITAPYNFVPLNEKVFYPSWADDVSHDVPFEDGESGEIEITITAKSPIFIRDSKDKEQFCNHNGEYYIPSSSVKGMVRNVLEIISFSKMNFVDDKTYSIRDLNYKKYMDKVKQGVNCGWLYLENNILKVEDCGEPFRIKYDEIDKKFNINFKQKFMEGTFDNAKSPYKNAFEKYKLISEDIFNNIYIFSSPKSDMTGRKIVSFDDSGITKGKLVLTGHPSPRKENTTKVSGKIYDFVFPIKEKSNLYEIDKKVFDDFKFAYFDGRKTQPEESKDWTFWKKRLNNGEKIPIFFHKNFSGISSFGLSYLYKFPYDNSIIESLLDSHLSNDLDLSETIFGFSKKIDNEQISLKGRVNFSHAKRKENSKISLLESRYILLGSPKASFYPIYLVQNGGEYKTLMDNNSVLAGWKRYPVHKNFTHKCNGKSKQTTLITPIKEGVQFKAKLKIHNLKSEEIGALISALTFHGNEKCFHSLGMGKSYGYGKIKITLDSINNFKYTIKEYMKFFESAINEEIFNSEIKWHESEQIKNLFSMASEQDDSNLRYMELSQFAKSKVKNEDGKYNFLDRYINLDNVKTIKAENLISTNDIEIYKKKIKDFRDKFFERKKEKENLKKEKEERNKKLQEQKKDWQNAKISNNIEAFNNFISKYPEEIEKIEEAQELINQIKSIQEFEQKQEKQKEANEKWNAIQKVDAKFKQKALEDFIANYPNSDKIELAKKELESISNTSKTPIQTINLDDLNSAKDGKKVKSILEKLSIDENNISKIISSIKEAYSNMKPKDQKNFFKDAQLGRFIGKEAEEELKNFF